MTGTNIVPAGESFVPPKVTSKIPAAVKRATPVKRLILSRMVSPPMTMLPSDWSPIEKHASDMVVGEDPQMEGRI